MSQDVGSPQWSTKREVTSEGLGPAVWELKMRFADLRDHFHMVSPAIDGRTHEATLLA